MNVTVEILAPCKKLLRVEVEPQKVDETFAEVAKEYQRQVKMPGFRPGKAPLEMVSKRFEIDIQNEVKKKLISDSYRKAISDEKISVVGQPDVEEIQFGKGQALQFAATLETAPDFELPEYKGLAAKRETGAVTTEEVEQALNLLRDRQSKYETSERELRDGNVAVVNYIGTCDGKPIIETAPTAKGLTEQKNFWINVDKTSFIPGFSEQLVGMKAGEKRTITVDFPPDFVTPQLAGKKGVYEVDLVEAKEKILPELSDEFAKSFGAENLEKLREGVRADLQNELNLKQSRSIRGQVVTALLSQIQADLPESLVLQETRNMVYEIITENQNRGLPKEVVDAQKDQIYATASANAKEKVKATFVFHRIAEKEGVRVEQAELGQRIQAMAAQYKMPIDKLVKELEKSDGVQEVYQQMLREKVADLLVQYAKIEDVPRQPKA